MKSRPAWQTIASIVIIGVVGALIYILLSMGLLAAIGWELGPGD
jgi:hypothetical protein